MIINSVASNKNVTFGYDKKLNERLISTLNNEPTDLNKVALKLNEFCNNTEDVIYLAEKQGKSAGSIDEMAELLIPIKLALTAFVTGLYPKLNYREKEVDHYTNLYEKDLTKKGIDITDNWKYDLATSLEFDDIDDDFEDDDDNDDDVDKMDNKPGPKVVKKANNVIQEFVPNAYSPKGFESIGGMDALKAQLEDKILYPINKPEEAQQDLVEYGKKYPRGILLYGPPGCGKTYIVEALAMEAKVPLFKLKISKAGSKYINETSSNYEKAFEQVEQKAKEIGKPCLLFIDEIDGFTKDRSEDSSAEDLKQMGTVLELIETARGRGIIVVGATNKYDIMDEAIKSRFDEQILLTVPDQKTREGILKKNLESRTKGQNLLNNQEDIIEIAKRMQDFSNRSICIISDKAALEARGDGRRDITVQDYIKVIKECQNLKIKEQKYLPRAQQSGLGFRFNHEA